MKDVFLNDTKEKAKERLPVLLITGLSGAGRLSVLKILEDLGYETIDNLPLTLLEQAINDNKGFVKPLAINIDLRSRHFSPESFLTSYVAFKDRPGIETSLVFLESDKRIIEKRYQETRRSHPLGHNKTLARLIEEERVLLNPLKESADHIIDTSLLTPLELKAFVRNTFGFSSQREFYVDVVSFAFPEGVPREANFIFDMRFLKNPHYDSELQKLTGQDQEVQDYLESLPLFKAFQKNLEALFAQMLPEVAKEGRGLFVLGFGCSGGRHRSVAMAELLYQWLLSEGYAARLYHRELKTSSGF